MSSPTRLLLFTLERQRFALPLADVELVVQAAEVTPLPGAPQIVLGVLDVRGLVIPVVSLRRRLGLPDRELRPSDHFLLVRLPARVVALVIDEAHGVMEIETERVRPASDIVPGVGPVKGVVTLEDGLLMIQDVDAFLSLEEAAVLEEALLATGGTR